MCYSNPACQPGLTLPSYLITSVQRIPRYILLLKVSYQFSEIRFSLVPVIALFGGQLRINFHSKIVKFFCNYEGN